MEKIKLSDAILKGVALDGFQVFESYFKTNLGEVVGCCVLGAAALGLHGKEFAIEWQAGEAVLFPFHNELNTIIPRTKWHPNVKIRHYDERLDTLLVHMNDTLHMSREEIAAWVKEIGF